MHALMQHLLFILPVFVDMYAYIDIYTHKEDKYVHAYLNTRLSAWDSVILIHSPSKYLGTF